MYRISHTADHRGKKRVKRNQLTSLPDVDKQSGLALAASSRNVAIFISSEVFPQCYYGIYHDE